MRLRTIVGVVTLAAMAGATGIGNSPDAHAVRPISGVTVGVFTGHVVNSVTGADVGGVTVHLTDTSGVDLPGSVTVTAPDGTFKLIAPTEEHGLRFDGSAVAHETGFAKCTAPIVVVPTWGEACTFGPTSLGDIQLDGLAPGSVSGLSLRSPFVRSITARFAPSAVGGEATDFVLTCYGGRTVTQVYTESGQTRTGFARGFNICSMVARNAAGTSAPVWRIVFVR